MPEANEASVLALPCDCGYVASGHDAEEFVAAAQTHAATVHRVELTRALILHLQHETRRALSTTAPHDMQI